MKVSRITCTLIALILFLSAGTAFGQVPSLFLSESDYFKVYSEISADHADLTAAKMEAFLDLFNSQLRFDLNGLPAKMTVRIFKSKERFNTYIKTIIDEEKNNFVFLQYSDPAKSELVGYYSETAEYDTALIRHGFLQFLKTFVRNPPLWLQTGFAVYFEKSQFDAENQIAVFKENLSWLPTIKSLIDTAVSGGSTGTNSFLSVNDLLGPGAEVLRTKKDLFYAQTWGLVTFLIGSENKQNNRLLWDSISRLKPALSQRENEDIVKTKVFSWASRTALINDFVSFISSIKTFPDLLRDGVDLYTMGDLTGAESSFIKAVAMQGEHYLPYYYLGLIQYSKKDYSLAEYYYQSALILGANADLIYYALGVNAFADSRYNDAENYLNQAVSLNAAEYTDKTQKLLKRIEGLKLNQATP